MLSSGAVSTPSFESPSPSFEKISVSSSVVGVVLVVSGALSVSVVFSTSGSFLVSSIGTMSPANKAASSITNSFPVSVFSVFFVSTGVFTVWLFPVLS